MPKERQNLVIGLGFDQDISKPFSDRRMINLYPRAADKVAFSEVEIIGREGVKEFLDTGSIGPCRGMLQAGGLTYAVIRTTVYRINEDATSTSLGAIGGSTSNVIMAFNGKTISIVDPTGGSYFLTIETGVVSLITNPAFLSFGQVIGVVYKSGYFVFNTRIEFFNSSLVTRNNGQDFNALDFGKASIDTDDLRIMHENHNQLYALSDVTTETYSLIQTTGFPFNKIAGANIQIGCAAGSSVIDYVNQFAFLGRGKNEGAAIWMVSDTTPTKISTPSIEAIINKNTPEDIANCVGDVYMIDGHYFGVWTIGKNTFRYDFTTSQALGSNTWHEMQTGQNIGPFQRWRCQHVTLSYGKLLIGDSLTGKIGELDPNHYFEFGDRIQRVVRSQPFGDGTPQRGMELQLFIESGVGNTDSQDPLWAMSYSDDGSKTFSYPITEPMGRVGEHSEFLVWRRMGRFIANRVLQFQTDDPVKIAITKLTAAWRK